MASAIYSVPCKTRPSHGLERASPAIVQEDLEFIIENGNNTLVCQAVVGNGDCKDGCYSGPLTIKGATIDSSNDFHNKSDDDEDVDSDDDVYDYEDLDQELDKVMESFDSLQVIQNERNNEETDKIINIDEHINSKINNNNEDIEEESCSSSSLSCEDEDDRDSVIFVGPRETFKCVDELLVATQESLCLRRNSSTSSTASPNNTVLRSGSADSGVSSQTGLSIYNNNKVNNISAVIAIDLGTTHSGYAYNVCREPGRQVHVMKRWEGGDSGLVNHKIPTALLLTPEGEFHSFGTTARDAYLDLPANETRTWLYFDRFKMILHRDSELHRDTPITATNGQTQPALIVFAHALKHFYTLSLKELKERCGDKRAPDINSVRWVITVPAMWRQPARQLIREAAYKASMCDDSSAERLLIVLEPEAAAVQCREQILQEYANEDMDGPIRFLVADCGGGTVDITLHEMSVGPDATLSELVPASGGPYGATGIDKEFESLLDNTFGNDFMSQFRTKRPAAYSELMSLFESRKRSASLNNDRTISLHPPYAFIDFLRKHCGKDVENIIKRNGKKDVEWCKEGSLRIHSTVLLRLFHDTVHQVVEHISEVLEDPVLENQPAQFLFLVGGFSESAVLQQTLREAFSSKLQVIAPQPSSLATLRGAVLYGLDSSVISARIARHSYGVGVLSRFIPGLHPSNKLVLSKDGGRWCADLLDCLVKAGQPITSEIRRYAATNAGQRHAVLHVYSADIDTPKFVTDEGVVRCGTLTLALDPEEVEENDLDASVAVNNEELREVQAQIYYSGTELVVAATCIRTGGNVKVHLDFLADD